MEYILTVVVMGRKRRSEVDEGVGVANWPSWRETGFFWVGVGVGVWGIKAGFARQTSRGQCVLALI